MKKYSHFLLSVAFALLINQNVNAQILNKIKKRVAETTENKILDRASEATERVIDNTEKSIKGEEKEVLDADIDDNIKSTTASSGALSSTETFKVYSKFDFIPGQNTVFYEDFASDEIGDFPARWDTNVSGEVVTTNSAPGKWFKLGADGGFFPDGIPELPDNFTIEFDVLLMHHGAMNPCEVNFDIGGGEKRNPLSDVFLGDTGILLNIGHYRVRASNYANQDYGNISASSDNTTILDNQGKPARISIWRQNQRLRLYLNETKVFDLPRAFLVNTTLDLIRFSTSNADVDPEEDCLISNIRVAVGAPDMRSKLITEGKLITQGILFDVNSDRIKPESAGTLKSITDVLKENPEVTVKIVGHTDSDGDDTANLALSKKRSAAVKEVLNIQYGIDSSRMETDGMGENNPIADNKTPEGKANNRRVELIKGL